MKRQYLSPTLYPLTIFIVILILAGAARAEDVGVAKTLYRFQGESDGANPTGNLIADESGNFYGTTEYNGISFYGTVFELSPPAKAGEPWTNTTLYSFHNDGDGARPTCGLIRDSAGNLYGTTSDSAAGGYGEIFELSPPSAPGGAWTETVLYHFTGGDDGSYPYGGLVSDPAGNFYGAATSSVFELSPPAVKSGAWTFTVLHNFHCCNKDGWNAVSPLVRDPAGDLYGVTEWGGGNTAPDCGSLGCGTVFEVKPPAAPGGVWAERVIHAFAAGGDGFNPFGGLTLDAAGNVYGTTYSGGTDVGGIAFQLSPPAQPAGAWSETVLHNFAYSFNDGAALVAGMVFDSSGNLYGTTEFGGYPCIFNTVAYGCGVVFELTPPATVGGAWSESIVRFARTLNSAKQPGASLYIDSSGNLYGTTLYGGRDTCTGDDGADGCGTVFEIVR
jgi:hypothetical protein